MPLKQHSLNKGSVFYAPGTTKWSQSATELSDISAYHNKGTLNGTASFDTDGVTLAAVGDFVQFDDNGGHTTFGDGSNDSPFTANIWVNPSAGSQHVRWLFMKDFEYGVYSWNASGTMWLFFGIWDYATSQGRVAQAAINPTVGEWTMCTFTYDGRGTNNPYPGMGYWKNGLYWTPYYTSGLAGTYTAMGPKKLPMQYGRDTGSAFLGTYSDLQVWNRELDADEIWALYKQGRRYK